MNEFWSKFWQCKNIAFLISASIAGGFGYLLIGLWALQVHNPLAMVLNLFGVACADSAYRLMGAEADRPDNSPAALAFAVASWALPVAAVALILFFPPPITTAVGLNLFGKP